MSNSYLYSFCDCGKGNEGWSITNGDRGDGCDKWQSPDVGITPPQKFAYRIRLSQIQAFKNPNMATLETTLEQAIAKIKQLAIEEQKEVIHFIEFLEFKHNQATIAQEQTNNTEQKPISFAEAAKDWIGCLDGLPSDLSTNKAYMEGFGL